MIQGWLKSCNALYLSIPVDELFAKEAFVWKGAVEIRISTFPYPAPKATTVVSGVSAWRFPKPQCSREGCVLRASFSALCGECVQYLAYLNGHPSDVNQFSPFYPEL